MACAHKGTCKYDCTDHIHTHEDRVMFYFIFLQNLLMVFFSSRVKAGPHRIFRPFSFNSASISLGFSRTLVSLGYYLMLKHLMSPLGPSNIYLIFFMRMQSTQKGGITCVFLLLLHLRHIELCPAGWSHAKRQSDHVSKPSGWLGLYKTPAFLVLGWKCG